MHGCIWFADTDGSRLCGLPLWNVNYMRIKQNICPQNWPCKLYKPYLKKIRNPFMWAPFTVVIRFYVFKFQHHTGTCSDQMKCENQKHFFGVLCKSIFPFRKPCYFHCTTRKPPLPPKKENTYSQKVITILFLYSWLYKICKYMVKSLQVYKRIQIFRIWGACGVNRPRGWVKSTI